MLRLGIKFRPNTTIDSLINPDAFEIGDSLAIIGAGNSAMDKYMSEIEMVNNKEKYWQKKSKDVQ